MPSTRSTEVVLGGGGKYRVDDTRYTSKDRNKALLRLRDKPSRSVSFKPLEGSRRIKPLVSRETFERNSPIFAHRLSSAELEMRRRDDIRNDVLRGIGIGFVGHKAYGYAKPVTEVYRARRAQQKGVALKPAKASGPTIVTQLSNRITERKTHPWSEAQLDEVIRHDPIMRRLPASRRVKRGVADRFGIVNYAGPKARGMRNAKVIGLSAVGGAAYAGAKYATSRRNKRDAYSFRFGAPHGRAVEELPLG